MNLFWWTLPGPNRFLQEVEDDLRAGRNAVVLAPDRFKGGVISEIWRRLGREDWHFAEFSEEAVISMRPLDYLCERFVGCNSIEAPSLEILADSPGFEGGIFAIELTSPNAWSSWRSFLEQYQRFSRGIAPGRRSLFLVLLHPPTSIDPPKDDICLSVHKWNGYVSKTDISLYAEQILGTVLPPGLMHDLVIACASNVALWDPGIVDAFATCNPMEIIDPFEFLSRFATENSWPDTKDDSTLDWASGVTQEFAGRSLVHSASLCLNNAKQAFEKRLWRAHLEVIMPFIEECRIDLVQSIREKPTIPIETPDGVKIADVSELELGQLLHLHRSRRIWFDSRAARSLSMLREMRNHLAHCRPIPMSLLASRQWRDLLADIERR